MIAFNIVDKATDEAQIIKNPAAVALGSLGGFKSGKARAEKLSPEQGKEIAQKAAQARWGKQKDFLEKHLMIWRPASVLI